MSIRQQDYLDTTKYKKSGAYHWKSYIFKKSYRKYVDTVINYLLNHENLKGPILDMGCGDGLFTYLLRKNGLTTYGYDIDLVALNVANIIDPDTKHTKFIYKVDYQTLLLFDVFEHIINLTNFRKRILNKIKKRVYLINPKSDSNYHVKDYTNKEIINLFNKWNFKLVTTINLKFAGKTLLKFKRF